jgi:uncharacterized protein
MAGKYELKKSKNGKFFFNLLAGNGQIILSSEMYETKSSALNGIESVRKNSGIDARYTKADGKSGEPYFTLKAGNHQVIAKSQMYADERGRTGGINSCKTHGAGAKLDDQTTA